MKTLIRIFLKLLSVLSFVLFSFFLIILAKVESSAFTLSMTLLFLFLGLFIWRISKRGDNVQKQKSEPPAAQVSGGVEKKQKVVPQKESDILRLESIILASHMNQYGYDKCLERVEYLESQLEKNDPFDLPENASSERYDDVSDKYYWLQDQEKINDDTISIVKKIGIRKGGHKLNIIDPPQEIQFDYYKEPNHITKRKGSLRQVNYARYKISVVVCEENSDIEKTFLLEKIKNVRINDQEIRDFQEYLTQYVRSRLEKKVVTEYSV